MEVDIEITEAEFEAEGHALIAHLNEVIKSYGDRNVKLDILIMAHLQVGILLAQAAGCPPADQNDVASKALDGIVAEAKHRALAANPGAVPSCTCPGCVGTDGGAQ